MVGAWVSVVVLGVSAVSARVSAVVSVVVRVVVVVVVVGAPAVVGGAT